MPNKKISELTAASTLDGTETVPIVQGGTTKRSTVADIAQSGTIVREPTAAGQTIQQALYAVDVSIKGGKGALMLVTADQASANKGALQVSSPRVSPAAEDVLASFDFAGSGFPGPITIIAGDGGIETGAYLVVSGHAKNTGSSARYHEGTLLRTMAAIWNDFIPASAAESTCVLTLRNNGPAYPSGDGGNCNVLLVIEDTSAGGGTGSATPGNERLAIRPKGDIYQHFTTHTTDAFQATDYERAHIGWDVTNSRHVIETQAGGTGTRRELLVKDRKFVTIASQGTFSATTSLGWWAAPRDCKIKAVKFVNETGFGVSGAAFWRAAVTLYIAGAYSSDIVNKGSDSAVISTDVPFDCGTPASTTITAGQVLRVFINKVGAPANMVTPTFIIEWEPV